MNNFIVYRHISPSGKSYIGITHQKPEHRWRNGEGYKNNIAFYNAIMKYGWNNFQHIIIVQNLSQDEASNLEKKLIQQYKTQDKNYGYNIKSGGLDNTLIDYQLFFIKWNECFTVNEIASYFNVSRNTVSAGLKTFGLNSNYLFTEGNKRRVEKLKQEKTVKILELWELGYIQKDIAKIVHCDLHFLRDVLDKNGIDEHQRRSRAASVNNKKD